MPCIYTITSQIDGKVYVGYTINLKKRKQQHFTSLRKGNHKNQHLQSAFNKHGADNFLFEELEECKKEHLPSQEHYWCYWLNALDHRYGYNIKSTHPDDRFIISKEGRLKIANKLRGKKRLDACWKGRKHTPEAIETMKIAALHRRRLKTYKCKVDYLIVPRRIGDKSKLLIKRTPRPGTNTDIRPLKGWKHSQEALLKITERSKKPDNINRIKLIQKEQAENRKGTKRPYEHLLNMSKGRSDKDKVINIYNKKGEFITSCKFHWEAANITGVSKSSIKNNLYGLSKSTKSHIFKYQEVNLG